MPEKGDILLVGGYGVVGRRIAARLAARFRFALVVTARGRGRTMTMSLAGRHQADATVAGAAELVRALVSAEIDEPGVWLPEQEIPRPRWQQGPSSGALRFGTEIRSEASARRKRPQRQLMVARASHHSAHGVGELLGYDPCLAELGACQSKHRIRRAARRDLEGIIGPRCKSS